METGGHGQKRGEDRQGSYRTYEEWKLVSGSTLRNSSFIVLTVPMRNGNFHLQQDPFGLRYSSSYRTYEEWKLCADCTDKEALKVLTVPMRNGNNDIFIRNLKFNIRFLPYL